MTVEDHDPMPVFAIKGKDRLALAAIHAYRQLCMDHGLMEQAIQVTRAYTEINGWQQRHPDAIKLPEHEHVPAAASAPRPPIVVLCGSTRFYDQFQRANYDLTMTGYIVLSVGFYPHAKAEHGYGEGVGHDSTEKVALDELHKRKIDLADEVYVLNVDGYIGESTRSEIEYAQKLGKPIRYLVDDNGRRVEPDMSPDGGSTIREER